MWKDEILVWEETDHAWDGFGVISSYAPEDDDLHAKGLVIWKKATLEDFIDKSVSLFDSASDFIDDKEILTAFMLVVSAASLFPFRLKIVKEDEVAEKFLSILNRDGSKQYILKKDLGDSEFGHLESLNLLIADLVNNGVLTDVNDRFIINGKVLNRSHITNDNSD